MGISAKIKPETRESSGLGIILTNVLLKMVMEMLNYLFQLTYHIYMFSNDSPS